MSDYFKEIENFIDFAKLWFRDKGWTLISALEFGSRSRDENTAYSDYDVSFFIYSSDKLYIPRYIYPDKTWHDLNQNEYFIQLQSTYCDCEFDWDDYIGKLLSDWGCSPGVKIEGMKVPIDIRWLLLQLAHESEHIDFLEFLCGDVLYDTGFCVNVRNLILSKRLFHSDGFLSILMSDALNGINSITADMDKRPWIHKALDAIIRIASCVSLVKSGEPVWKTHQVRTFIKSECPRFSSIINHLYEMKSSDVGRQKSIKIALSERKRIQQKLAYLHSQCQLECGIVSDAKDLFEMNKKHYYPLLERVDRFLPPESSFYT